MVISFVNLVIAGIATMVCNPVSTSLVILGIGTALFLGFFGHTI